MVTFLAYLNLDRAKAENFDRKLKMSKLKNDMRYVK